MMLFFSGFFFCFLVVIIIQILPFLLRLLLNIRKNERVKRNKNKTGKDIIGLLITPVL